ncbi:hypothetical protein AURDEDRAFT_175988 [Auricularia subglabra TFB-10046 SS5]|nr:hypothetical protein AURDEDRAFT_175988 [Auricularia subglabra TFB-10046 SS5]
MAFYHDPRFESPDNIFELPTLHKLEIRGHAMEIPARFPTAVRMGSLEYLALHFGVLTATRPSDLAEFLNLYQTSLRTLHIQGLNLAAPDGAILSSLNKISTLSLENCTISPEFLLTLRDGLNGLLSVKVTGGATTFSNETAVEAFLDFVRARCHANLDAANPRQRLIDVQVSRACGLSDRDELEIEQLLDPRALH